MGNAAPIVQDQDENVYESGEKTPLNEGSVASVDNTSQKLPQEGGVEEQEKEQQQQEQEQEKQQQDINSTDMSLVEGLLKETTADTAAPKQQSPRVEEKSSKEDAPDAKNSESESAAGSKEQTNGVVSDAKQSLSPTSLSDDDHSLDEDDIEPVEVLLQFIPYYGQGDPSNDSIVRATLSALSVEDIDSKDEYGNTLLLLACQYRCEDLVRMMLNKGADPNAVNSSGACCLHFACYRESASFQVAKVLLQNGANPDVAESTFGCTPLHYCAGTGDIKFCKLLLSYGAQITSRDYYNYTCVDYAKEAGMVEVENFLRQHYDKAQGSAMHRNKAAALSPQSSSKDMSAYSDMSKWESHVDPESKNTYYIHLKTGECLWENELKQRIDSFKATQQKKSKKGPPPDQKRRPPPQQPKQTPEYLITQATQTRLIAFLTKHDPSRLAEMEGLMGKYKGREAELLKDLCAQYKVEEDSEFKAFEKKLSEIKKQQEVANPPQQTVQVVSQTDQKKWEEEKKAMEKKMDEEKRAIRKEYEAELEEQKVTMKKKIEAYLEEEKNSYRKLMSEKEGIITHLKSELDSSQKQKEALESETRKLQTSIDRGQVSEENKLEKADVEIVSLKGEVQSLNATITGLQNEVSVEKDKMKSLELTLTNLTADSSEKIAKEQAAAEERAVAQKERDAEHAHLIKDLESKSKICEVRMKSDFSKAKNEWAKLEKALKEEQEQVKRSKDNEINELRRDLADVKSKASVEISEAKMLIEDFKEKLKESEKRTDYAEASAKAAQDEIADAKITQKHNAQLHQDLLREQTQRKKLHNEIEDMKGKIRVYVRVRPFSKSEIAKNCTESVIKDGKQSVMVKGIGAPDAKKFYDFDSVFGGDNQNTQEDVFKDTKHLMMSVLDGYNVCIFAYGQTGAGKSFTMIGAADIGTCLSSDGEFDALAGITPRAVSEIFRLLNERSSQCDFSVDVQMFQLYRDGLEDLLKEEDKKKNNTDKAKEKPLKITLAEHSATGLVHIEGAAQATAYSSVEVMKLIETGSKRRTTASTQMNAESSRSHLICMLKVTMTNKKTGNLSTGKLTLVDLAGSERLDKSGAAGEAMKEAQSINKSLSALGDVIAGLTTGQQHIPYRNHPLTMLMSDSIGGNAKTLMFVNTSPADYNSNESNSSLAFAARCKDVTNAATAGPGANAAQLKALKNELAKLKKGGGGGGGGAQLGGLRRP